MSQKYLAKIIKNSESQTIEWKPSLSQVNEVIQTIGAFVNTEGGRIIIGVSKSGKLLGLNIGKSTIEDLSNKIHQNLDPKIHPTITTKSIERKEIIILDVKESSDHLVLAFGRPYKRMGKSTVRMSKDEYERLVLEKHKEKLYFDSRICKGAILKNIDKEAVENFLKRANIERRFSLNLKTPIKEVLTRLNLIANGKLTNACVLLFAKNPQKLFPQAQIKCARFKGIKPLEFIDMKVLSKNIIQQREDALEFIKEHIKLSAKIVGTQRIEEWEYPIEAIREALSNAICHRDYSLSTEIQIRIFDDRLEVW